MKVCNRPSQSTLLISASIVLIATEIASMIFPPIGALGAVLWTALSLGVTCMGVCSLFYLFRSRAFLTLAVLGVWYFMIFSNMTTPQAQHHEITQELGCAVLHIQEQTDRGFRQTCLFGYPMRQLYLPSLPTFILGRTQLAQNLGGSFWFLIGIAVFGACVVRRFRGIRGDMLAAAHIAMLMHFRNLNHFAFSFEQSIFPISWALIIIGSMLAYTPARLPAILALSCIAVFGYTPALALIPLVLLFLAHRYVTRRHERPALSAAIIVIIFEFISSFYLRGDFNVIAEQQSARTLFFDHLLPGFIFLFSPGPGAAPFAEAPLLWYLLAVLVAWTFSAFRSLKGFLALWIWGVLAFALTARGYCYFPPSFQLHKALVSIPAILVLSIATITFISGYSRYLLFLLLPLTVALTWSGVFIQHDYLGSRSAYRHLAFVQWLGDLSEWNQPVSLFMSHELEHDYVSLNDALQYYHPRINAQMLEKCSTFIDAAAGEKDVFLLARPDTMKNRVCSIPLHQITETFSFEQDPEIALFRP